MTDNNQNSTDAKQSRKPDWRLVQEKAYHQMGRNGQLNRKSKTVDIAVGWSETSSSGMEYISWSDSVMTVSPDVDGRVKLVSFPISE